MLRVTEVKILPGDYPNKIYQIQAFADAKEDVTAGAEFVGMPSDAVMAVGSTVVTAKGEVAFLKSDGSWSWV